MFSSFFGKRRSSPVEEERPPIPGPAPDDGFVVVSPASSRGLYPNVSGMGGPALPYPQRPAPPAPHTVVDQNFNYLQGVPFSLSRDLKMASNKDSYASEIGEMLSFLTNRVNMGNYDYDFTTEKGVLKECE